MQMKVYIFLLAGLLVGPAVLGQPGRYDPAGLYPVDSVKADLRFLQRKLEAMHPGLYRYEKPAGLRALFDSLYRVIDRPLSGQSFLSLLELVAARIRNGHTMILPGAAAMEYYGTRGRSLPLLVVSAQGRSYVLENNSADSGIAAGLEVVSINGVAAGEVRRQLLMRSIRDGYNETYPTWLLDHYFAAYYRFCFGEPEEFLLELRGKSGVVFQKRIRALTRDSVTYYRALRYGQDHPVVEAGLGIVARRKDDGQTAILKISSFDPDILQSRYQQDYRRAMDSVFLWLERMRITRLVVDLRDNQGGDFPPGRYLLAYLLATPASFLFGGPEARVIRPAAHRFAGKLVVLVNGGSFSSTAIVAAILEREKRAVFVGEETGGNKYLISGDPAEVLLPHTGISCSISTVIFRIGKGVNNGHGVMPEYRVVPGIEDRLARRDPALEKAIAVP